jgi:hypothetical protein
MRWTKSYAFDDGSSIEWVDRETLEYFEGEYSALVWVDYAPGFFSSGRIIRTSSIQNWKKKPPDAPERIDDESRARIIEKVVQYYRAGRTPVTIEE